MVVGQKRGRTPFQPRWQRGRQRTWLLARVSGTRSRSDSTRARRRVADSRWARTPRSSIYRSPISGPVLGLVARGFGLSPVFLATVIAALTAVILAWRLADQKAVGRVEPQRQ
jgi:hypothetical protein